MPGFTTSTLTVATIGSGASGLPPPPRYRNHARRPSLDVFSTLTDTHVRPAAGRVDRSTDRVTNSPSRAAVTGSGDASATTLLGCSLPHPDASVATSAAAATQRRSGGLVSDRPV